MQVYTKEVKDEVRQLRVHGLSLNEIYHKKHIPKTTIRGWIAGITLTDNQREKFKQRTMEKLQQGRIMAQKLQKEIRLDKEREFLLEGIKEIDKISKRDLFIIGIALYWAEGFKNKHEHRLGFCNSDPKMLEIYILWLERCFGINRKDLILRVTLNKSYQNQIEEIEKYWSILLNVPITQFTKPFFQNTTWKKQYETNNYKGVVRIHVKDSLELLLKMRGWIEGLKMIK